MAHYDSAYLDYVIVVFMVIAGINFSLHYQLLRGKNPYLLAGFRMPVFSGALPGSFPLCWLFNIHGTAL